MTKENNQLKELIELRESQKIASPEVDPQVKLFLNKFSTFGEAIKHWNDASYGESIKISGELGDSIFSTDLNWLVSLYGSKSEISIELKQKSVKKTKNSVKKTEKSIKKIKKRRKF